MLADRALPSAPENLQAPRKTRLSKSLLHLHSPFAAARPTARLRARRCARQQHEGLALKGSRPRTSNNDLQGGASVRNVAVVICGLCLSTPASQDMAKLWTKVHRKTPKVFKVILAGFVHLFWLGASRSPLNESDSIADQWEDVKQFSKKQTAKTLFRMVVWGSTAGVRPHPGIQIQILPCWVLVRMGGCGGGGGGVVLHWLSQPEP